VARLITTYLDADHEDALAEFVAVQRNQRQGVHLTREHKKVSALERLADSVPGLIDEMKAERQEMKVAHADALLQRQVSWAEATASAWKSVVELPATIISSVGDASSKMGMVATPLLVAVIPVGVAGVVLGDRSREYGEFRFYTPTDSGVDAAQNVAREPEEGERSPVRPEPMPAREDDWDVDSLGIMPEPWAKSISRSLAVLALPVCWVELMLWIPEQKVEAPGREVPEANDSACLGGSAQLEHIGRLIINTCVSQRSHGIARQTAKILPTVTVRYRLDNVPGSRLVAAQLV
jgi:hypothetical protein